MQGRQIEMLNIFVGFEQTNRYVISACVHTACTAT